MTFDGNFNTLDAALFVGGFVPIIGSVIAIADAAITCAEAWW